MLTERVVLLERAGVYGRGMSALTWSTWTFGTREESKKAITANNSIWSDLHNRWNGKLWIMKRLCNNLLGKKKKNHTLNGAAN